MKTAKKSRNNLTRDDIDALKEVVDPEYLIENLGFKIERDNSHEVRATCAVHGGDNKSAFRFNKDRRTWVCFTHKCHETHGNDIIGLIQAVQGTNFRGAVDYLKDLVGDISSYKVDMTQKKFKKEKEKFVNQYGKPEKPDYVCDESLNLFKRLRSPYFEIKGFSEETLDYFEIAGGYTDSWGIVRDIIPIRNVKGELVAYSLRDTRKNCDDDYKYILTTPFDKDNTLYNLNNARLFGTEIPLIVVEGFKSVWKLYEYGIYNVVAVMGSAITEGQIKLLKAYALKGIAVMFDPDKSGKDGADRAEIDLAQAGIEFDILKMLPEEGEDPADLNLEQAYRYFNDYIR